MADHDVRHATQQATSTEVVSEESNTADFGSNAQNTANTPPVDPIEGSALTPEQAAEVDDLVERTRISLDAWEVGANKVPEGLAPAAAYAAEMATLTIQMVEEDAAALADTSPDEGGALAAAQLRAGCELGTFYGGMGKDFMLGKVFGEGSPESLAASAVSTASTVRDNLDKVNAVGHGFARADATLSAEVLDGAEGFLGAAGGKVEATEQLLELLSVVQEFVGAVREAQSAKADLAAAMAALGPVLGLARSAVHETLVDLAGRVAEAAWDVDRFEGEWRGR